MENVGGTKVFFSVLPFYDTRGVVNRVRGKRAWRARFR